MKDLKYVLILVLMLAACSSGFVDTEEQPLEETLLEEVDTAYWNVLYFNTFNDNVWEIEKPSAYYSNIYFVLDTVHLSNWCPKIANDPEVYHYLIEKVNASRYDTLYLWDFINPKEHKLLWKGTLETFMYE